MDNWADVHCIFACNDDTDVDIANYIHALRNHPSICELTIVDDEFCIYTSTDTFRGFSVSSGALQHLIASSSSLSVLTLKNISCGTLDRILFCPESALTKIDYWPRLSSPLPQGNSEENWELMTNMERRKKPITLVLHNILYHEDSYTKVEQFLHSHPEIRLKLPQPSLLYHKFSQHHGFWYLKEFNRCGRYLLDYYPRNNEGDIVPVSLWPLVLAKAKWRKWGPSIIFEFLTSDSFLDGYVSHLQGSLETAATNISFDIATMVTPRKRRKLVWRC